MAKETKVNLNQTISVTVDIDKKLKRICVDYDLFEYQAIDAALDLLAKDLRAKSK